MKSEDFAKSVERLIEGAKKAEKYLRENPTHETLSIVTDLQASIHHANESLKKRRAGKH
jgi:hypothetical protein